MTGLRLSLTSIRYYAWSHLCVMAGVALAVAVLVGALLVGDSVRYSLRQTALARLGRIHYAMDLRGRPCRADLADRLQAQVGSIVAPALLLPGIAIGPSARQVNGIQVVGVDDRIGALANGRAGAVPDDGIALNAKLAAELGVKPGDWVSIRFSKPSLLPRDAPLSSRKGDDMVRGTFTVSAIWDGAQLGNFGLAANQVVPCNAFLSLKTLQEIAGLDHQANLLLAGDAPVDLDAAVKRVWSLDDLGLLWRPIPGGGHQLESRRVVMDAMIGRAVTGLTKATGALTYLVNSISRCDATAPLSTPYSFVLALGPCLEPRSPGTPVPVKDDEILISRWLADQLALQPGNEVRLTYYEYASASRLVETSRVFRVGGIVAMEALVPERDLAPRFPGLTDAGRCADWDIGMPIDEKKREDPANEAYWNEYRDTPKAIVTLKAGQSMWANRFGNLTAIRFAGESADARTPAAPLRAALDPAVAGLRFLNVRHTALRAVSEAMDFGGLFLGMSCFVIVSALMLTALLFSFGIRQRSREIGLLLAIGYRPIQVRWRLVGESAWVAGAGAVLGSLSGALYTRGLIWGLGHLWQGAVASAPVFFHAERLTIVLGGVAGFAMALVALVVSAWRQASRPVCALLADSGDESMAPAKAGYPGLAFSCLGLCGALVLVVLGVRGTLPDSVAVFFGAGALLLASLLGTCWFYFTRLSGSEGRLTVASLGCRNAGRHRRRSVTVVGLLACGCFLVFAVSAMQVNLEKQAGQRFSGTGGFSLVGECAVPLPDDLSSAAGLKRLRLDQAPCLKGVKFVSIRVREGDDASCLNLNHAQSPRVLGVDPEEFGERGAFCRGDFGAPVWSLLGGKGQDGIAPALAGDADTLQWGLKRRAGEEDGDVLVLRDEWGQPFPVRLVGTLPMRLSLFQGSLLVSASAFAARYPSESGTRMFLVDSSREQAGSVQACLVQKLEKFGVSVVPAVQRLKEFYAVETAYLAMFLALGGLGLLLGSAGMGIVVIRAIRERRAEYALLKAVGYSGHRIRAMVASEHRLLFALGLVAGAVSAGAAIWPQLTEPGIQLPLRVMAAFLAGILLLHWFWISLAVRWAFRSSLIAALREL